jgi:serine protease Do
MKITNIMATLIPLTVLILTIPVKIWAKTPNEIAEMAIPVTVQINSIAGGGSGVIIARKKDQQNFIYQVLTADHVVKSAAIDYTIRTYIGENYIATSVEHLLKSNNDPDLALVTFSSPNQYPTVNLGNSDQVQIGDKIAIFAYPYLDDQQRPDERLFVYSSGGINTVNAKRPNGYELLYDATTQKGMSGGPVFNQNGELIGIHGRGEKLGGEEGKYAFNAAIPINTFLTLEKEYKVNVSPQNSVVNVQQNSNLTLNTDVEELGRYAGASEFYCDLSGENPRTMARNVVNNQTKVLINWVGKTKDDQDWGINAEKRCQIVSGKFQKAYYENKLDYLTDGLVNNLPVICAITNINDDCDPSNMLFTLKKDEDPVKWINNYLKGEPQPVRGKVFINMNATLAPLLKEDQ